MPQKEVLVADEDQHHKDGRKQRTLFCRHVPLVVEAHEAGCGRPIGRDRARPDAMGGIGQDDPRPEEAPVSARFD
jgi:hypothetical protein